MDARPATWFSRWYLLVFAAFPVLLGAGTCISGEYVRTGPPRAPKPEGTPVAIFMRGAKAPARPYQEIAKLHVVAKENKSDWASVSAELERLARAVGADAVLDVVVKQGEEPPISHMESTAPPQMRTTADVRAIAVVWTGPAVAAPPAASPVSPFPAATRGREEGGQYNRPGQPPPGQGIPGVPPPPPGER
jgi:hypothetical protein